MGGKFHLKLNIDERPIANKYREGKMKSTLERELTVREIAIRETLEVRHAPCVQPKGVLVRLQARVCSWGRIRVLGMWPVRRC